MIFPAHTTGSAPVTSAIRAVSSAASRPRRSERRSRMSATGMAEGIIAGAFDMGIPYRLTPALGRATEGGSPQGERVTAFSTAAPPPRPQAHRRCQSRGRPSDWKVWWEMFTWRGAVGAVVAAMDLTATAAGAQADVGVAVESETQYSIGPADRRPRGPAVPGVHERTRRGGRGSRTGLLRLLHRNERARPVRRRRGPGAVARVPRVESVHR